MESDRGLKPFSELKHRKSRQPTLGNAEEALDLEREAGLN